MAERIIKLSCEAQKQNEIERLKRKFNNINNDTSTSNHRNSLTSSMLSQSITQTTTSLEEEKPLEEKKNSNKESKNSQMNDFNKNNKNFLSLKKVEQISKLNARKNSSNPTKISYISTKNDIGKISNLNLPQNKKQEITTKNISKFHSRSQSNLVKNRSETPQSKNQKSENKVGILTQSQEKLETIITFKPNSNFYNSTSFLINKFENKNNRNKIVSASYKNFNERSISSAASKQFKNEIDSNIENSRLDRMMTVESQTTQIIQMNNKNTEKILSTLIINIFNLDKASKNRIPHSTNSSFFVGGTISPVMDYKKGEFFYLAEIENPLEKEKEPLISNENIPPENNDSIVNNNNNYMERIKKITGFAEIKKTYTKDTEVIEAQSELDYNMLNYQISEQSMLHNSILNTVERDNIFYINPTWLLSNRLINDEKNCLNRQVTVSTPHYKFLERVREDSNKAVCFKTKFFLLLDEDAMYNLLCFIFDKYKILTKINKLIERKICLTLNSKFEKAIKDFRENYGNVLELQEFYFNHSEIKKLNPDSKENAESN